MASGQPFSDREKQFIRDNAGRMSHGKIAQELSQLFPEDNSGYRSYRSVRSFLYRERIQTDQLLTIRIPAHIINQAKAAGKTLDDISEIAKTAVLTSFSS